MFCVIFIGIDKKKVEILLISGVLWEGGVCYSGGEMVIKFV